MSHPEPPQEHAVTLNDFRPLESKMALICGACGKTGRYRVGKVFADPTLPAGAGDQPSAMRKSVGFTGYFHCARCGAGGPWDLPAESLVLLIALLAEALATPDKARINVGHMHLFDGTVIHSATEAEAHLKKLIEASPDDYFLWGRLGNLYDGAERPDLAAPAFQRAVELSPTDVGPHYTLGCYRMEDKQHARAAQHFHQVLLHARSDQRTGPRLLRDMVRDALERLIELSEGSRGAIGILPSREEWAAVIGPAPTLAGTRFDLSSEKGLEVFVTFILTGQAPAMTGHRSVAPSPAPRRAPEVRPSTHVGRNAPCPCGSGKKFKNCCRRS